MDPFKTRGELMCSEGITVPASTCITSRVTFIRRHDDLTNR
jgi:hypothetical protein